MYICVCIINLNILKHIVLYIINNSLALGTANPPISNNKQFGKQIKSNFTEKSWNISSLSPVQPPLKNELLS